MWVKLVFRAYIVVWFLCWIGPAAYSAALGWTAGERFTQGAEAYPTNTDAAAAEQIKEQFTLDWTVWFYTHLLVEPVLWLSALISLWALRPAGRLLLAGYIAVAYTNHWLIRDYTLAYQRVVRIAPLNHLFPAEQPPDWVFLSAQCLWPMTFLLLVIVYLPFVQRAFQSRRVPDN